MAAVPLEEPEVTDMNEPWTAPPGDGTAVVPIGDVWDVVEAPAETAAWVRQLRRVEAPAIVDPRQGRAWWLIPRGSANPTAWLWHQLQPTVVVRTSGSLIVPHAARSDGLRWVKPHPWGGTYLAQPERLAAVLTLLRSATAARRASVSPFYARGDTDAGPG
ncbi:hypothetical protein [Streptomyces rimosus]|nr:hypothetical protein [Streptomyces rimosus]